MNEMRRLTPDIQDARHSYGVLQCNFPEPFLTHSIRRWQAFNTVPHKRNNIRASIFG
jgi:hypothetical protein